MTLLEFYRSLRNHSPQDRGATSSSFAAGYSTPTRKVVGLSWVGKALGAAILIGKATMSIGQAIVDLGFRVTLYGFSIWLVSSTIKHLGGPIAKMIASDAVNYAPQEAAA